MSKMHVSLNVSDLERSLGFYQAFFGVPPHKVRPGYANFDVSEPPLKLALNAAGAVDERGPLNHLGIVVESLEQVRAARQRLAAAGLPTIDESDTQCCFARQDKVWAHDPDGNAWEIYVLLDDLQDDHDHDHAGNPLSGAERAAPTCCVPSFGFVESPASCCVPSPGAEEAAGCCAGSGG